VDCAARVAEVCPGLKTPMCAMSAAKGLPLAASCASMVAPECSGYVMQRQMLPLDNTQQTSPCKDEMHKARRVVVPAHQSTDRPPSQYCGKQIDDLKKAVSISSVVGIVKGVADVVQCLGTNAEAIAKKCSPFTGKPEATVVCLRRIDAFCPELLLPFESPEALSDAGACLPRVLVLGDECVNVAATPLASFLDSSSSACHDELHKKCGKQVGYFS